MSLPNRLPDHQNLSFHPIKKTGAYFPEIRSGTASQSDDLR